MKFDIKTFRNTSLPSQQEIISPWKSSTPIVSIICTTYNQEPYIEDALIGFLIQKTDFPFEIIIHDDASSDRTTEIVKKYQEKYKNILKLITQQKNQYSQAANSPFLIAANNAKGEYLALCEGDDFWIDNQKLQTQKNLLDANKRYSLITHNAYKIYPDGLSLEFSRKKQHFFTAQDILKKHTQFAPTASYFFRKELITQLPIWFISAPIGDLFIELYSTKMGECLFSPVKHCAYRINSINSWSTRTSSNSEKKINTLQKIITHLHLASSDFPELKKEIHNRIIEFERMIAIEHFIKNPKKTNRTQRIEEYRKFLFRVRKFKPFSPINLHLALPPHYDIFYASNLTRTNIRSNFASIYKSIKKWISFFFNT